MPVGLELASLMQSLCMVMVMAHKRPSLDGGSCMGVLDDQWSKSWCKMLPCILVSL
jgi:hypothetical protein